MDLTMSQLMKQGWLEAAKVPRDAAPSPTLSRRLLISACTNGTHSWLEGVTGDSAEMFPTVWAECWWLVLVLDWWWMVGSWLTWFDYLHWLYNKNNTPMSNHGTVSWLATPSTITNTLPSRWIIHATIIECNENGNTHCHVARMTIGTSATGNPQHCSGMTVNWILGNIGALDTRTHPYILALRKHNVAKNDAP